MVDPLNEPISRPLRHPHLTIGAAGLLAGLLSYGLGEMTHEFFAPKEVAQPLGGGEVMRPTLETIAVADSRNSALTFGTMGGVLGLVLGVAGGLRRRSIGSAASAGGAGLVVGAMLGVVLPLALIVPFHRMQVDRNSDDLLVPIGLHAALWGPLGAVGGLAYGLGRGRPGLILRCMLGGLVGAIAGTIVYDVIGAAVSPLAGTSEAISTTWPTRLLARLLVSVGAAVGIARAARVPEVPVRSLEPPGPDPRPAGGP
jgi:hypothetical protein